MTITAISDFAGMSISLWLALYLLARGRSNRLTFMAVLSLLALASYFFNAYSHTINPLTENHHIRAFSITAALLAGYHLSHTLLPTASQERYRWVGRGLLIAGLAVSILILSIPSEAVDNPILISPPPLLAWSILPNLFHVLVAVAILVNLWQANRLGPRAQNKAFYLSMAFGISAIGYGLAGVAINRPMPRFVANLLIITALILLSYAITRHQVLIERRVAAPDLPVSTLAIFTLSAIYLFVAWQLGLTPIQIGLLAVLAISSHAAYDLVRDSLERLLRREDRSIRRQVRQLTRPGGDERTLEDKLQRGLAILCYKLESTRGFIALRQADGYQVKATLQSLPPGTFLPEADVEGEAVFAPGEGLREYVVWLAPGYSGEEQQAVVGIGPRRGLKSYTQSDLNWLEDVADQIGNLVHSSGLAAEDAPEQPAHKPKPSASQTSPMKREDNLFSTLALKLEPEFIKSVENGLRNLHDYIYLGRSPLSNQLQVPGDNHIERGQAVHRILVETIRSLRPPGKRPAEPLPRAWYHFVILHDAYVEDVPDREIMARLYISEGTFYRNRRKALRGVSRAIFEAGYAAPQNVELNPA